MLCDRGVGFLKFQDAGRVLLRASHSLVAVGVELTVILVRVAVKSPSCVVELLPLGHLRVVGGQFLVEHGDLLVASQGHALRIEESRGQLLVPDKIVAKERSVRIDEIDVEHPLRKEHDRSVILDHPLVFPPEIGKGNNNIRLISRHSIGKVTTNQVDASCFDGGQNLQAIVVV